MTSKKEKNIHVHRSKIYKTTILLVPFELLLFLLQDQNGPINLFKLPGPRGVVQKGPEIEPVIIGTVRFCVVCWREGRHLVPVDRVVKEEPLHFHRDLCCKGYDEKKKNEKSEKEHIGRDLSNAEKKRDKSLPQKPRACRSRDERAW